MIRMVSYSVWNNKNNGHLSYLDSHFTSSHCLEHIGQLKIRQNQTLVLQDKPNFVRHSPTCGALVSRLWLDLSVTPETNEMEKHFRSTWSTEECFVLKNCFPLFNIPRGCETSSPKIRIVFKNGWKTVFFVNLPVRFLMLDATIVSFLAPSAEFVGMSLTH